MPDERSTRPLSRAFKTLPAGVYLILDGEVARGRSLVDVARSAIAGGVRIFQYREKTLPRGEMYRVAKALRAVTREGDATFIMNDWCDVALAVEADGVHLGQDDLPLAEARAILGHQRLIGISAHSMEQAIAAEEGGADYIGFGPLYHTTTKDIDTPPLGAPLARELRARISIPIFGIGGIHPDNLEEVRRTGVHGVAVLSGILQAPDVEPAARRFVSGWITAP